MSVSTVHAVYFSGTGTTEKTVRRIARRLADKLGAAYAEYSYTLPDARKRELTVPAGDLAVVGCPTYAGRVPNLLMPYLRDMVHGAGALAVPVALFGNRNYDDALMELSKLLTADGFTCVAGAAFVGEHSFSRTLGAGSFFIIFKEVLPNIIGPIITQVMFSIPTAIFTEAFLSFVGLGIPVPQCSLGSLISELYNSFTTHPYQIIPPIVVMSLLMLSFNLLADGLREALDPKMKSM